MRHQLIILKELTTYDECILAIDSIEFDHRNVIGGRKAYESGYETWLTSAAEKKIKSIKARVNKLFLEEE